MGFVYDGLMSMIGQPPAGYEPVLYIVATIIIYQLYMMLLDLFKKAGGFI